MERKPGSASNQSQHRQEIATTPAIYEATSEEGSVFYSGQVHLNGQNIRWEPQERRMDQLLDMNTEKAAKILATLGNKRRLDILKAVMAEPLSGAELVERLNMGTTGQLYHHLKAALGADLLVQEQGGRYALPKHRSLPFLLFALCRRRSARYKRLPGDDRNPQQCRDVFWDFARLRYSSVALGRRGKFDIGAHERVW